MVQYRCVQAYHERKRETKRVNEFEVYLYIADREDGGYWSCAKRKLHLLLDPPVGDAVSLVAPAPVTSSPTARPSSRWVRMNDSMLARRPRVGSDTSRRWHQAAPGARWGGVLEVGPALRVRVHLKDKVCRRNLAA